jgi:DNA-binding transcriptional LysR family regulator
MFALEGLGVLLTFRNLVNCSSESGLVFRPLDPQLETHLYLIWNKYQTFTPLTQKFLDQVRTAFSTLIFR